MRLCLNQSDCGILPRPPEPHATGYRVELRHPVAITRGPGHRCRNSEPEDQPSVVRNSLQNSQQGAPLNATAEGRVGPNSPAYDLHSGDSPRTSLECESRLVTTDSPG